jgi:hypothetical protein
MRNNNERRLQRVVAYTCATLFSLFSFVYIACYQAPLLEMLYNHVATGKLEYNSAVVAAVITAFLTVLAVWLNRFARFQREWTAVAYLPSSLILAFVTDIDRFLFTGDSSIWGWVGLFILGILVYLFLSFVLHRMLFEKIKNLAMSTNKMLWRNLILLVLLFSLVGTISNGEENIKREALIASYYKKGEVENALNVGYNSLDASPQLTALRAYVMAKEGLLGEKLFEYPLTYGVKALLPGKVQDSPLVPDSVYTMLGAIPGENDDVITFLKGVANTDSASSAAKEYYLSALLLDKRLLEFKESLYLLNDTLDVDELPKHYREALVLYSGIDTTYVPDFTDKSIIASLDSLRDLELQHDDFLVRGNMVRQAYGRTYWWYFLYGY